MTKGIGTDIIEIARIERIIERYGQKFLDRMFTEPEQTYCSGFRKPSQHFAGRFAAKEAIVKALGTGIRDGLEWTDIEIINDKNGKPIVHLSEKIIDKFIDPEIQISISHSKEYATAVALYQ